MPGCYGAPEKVKEKVKIRNGKEIDKSVAKAYYFALTLLRDNPEFAATDAIFDLIDLCNNPRTKIAPESQEVLYFLRMVDKLGRLEADVKDIALSSIFERKGSIFLISPFV